jgi:diaminopimelate epimerase
MQIRFFKMQGAGNQIVVVDGRDGQHPLPSPQQVRQLGDSGTGPGFDSLMWLMPPSSENSLASYRVFNRDGGEVEQCGNGARCVAWLLAREHEQLTEFQLEAPTGIIRTRILADKRLSLDMGRPDFRPENVPFIAESAAKSYEIELKSETLEVRVVSMGNPHCILLVDSVATARVAELGPLLESHHRFPKRTNVGFVAIKSRSRIDLRVFERGVGETGACGTGACAAMVTARQADWIDSEVTVNLPGGQLVVSWPRAAASVWLTGTAELICEGTTNL